MEGGLTVLGRGASVRRSPAGEPPDGLGEPGMPRVSFTPNIQRHVACPPAVVGGDTVGDALAAVFAANPRARGYVLDDQGGLRPHMLVFVDGTPVRDRVGLGDPVAPDAEIHVMQALSGG